MSFFMHFLQFSVVFEILYVNSYLVFYISLINKYQCYIIMSYVEQKKRIAEIE